MIQIKNKENQKEDDCMDIFDTDIELVEHIDDQEQYNDFSEYQDKKDKLDEGY